MTRIAVIFGLIAGAILGGMMALSVPLYVHGILNFDVGEIFGYTTMVLAFIVVFFGIRSYRDNVAFGRIGFWKAFQVGIFMTFIASAIYVLTWEVIYYNFFPDFMDKYGAYVTEKLKADGASPAALAAKKQEMADFKRLYANPLYNAAFTFLEVFPVGLVMTLISAGILRKRGGQPPSAVPLTT